MFKKIIYYKPPFRISVVTVVYNNKAYIADAIRSVQSQNYSDVEHIIIDGASTDGTVDVIKDFGNSVDIFVSEKDLGLYDAMNKGIRLASGKVVGMLNSDDMFSSGKSLSIIASAFNSPDIDGCYGDLNFVKRENPSVVVRTLRSKPYHDGLFERAFVPPHPTFYLKKDLYDKYGYYRTDYEIAADAELQYRLMHSHKIKTRYLPQLLVNMRMGGISNRLRGKIKIISEIKRAITDNGGNFNYFTYMASRAKKLAQFSPFSYIFNP